jgi:uncharacterized protein YbcV (DUF1398 family)
VQSKYKAIQENVMDTDLIRGISKQAKQEKWQFPKKVIELKKAGVKAYKYDLQLLESEYELKDGSGYLELHPGIQPDTAAELDIDALVAAIRRHKTEKITFFTFCNEAALAGVLNWKVDLDNMTCTYFGKNDSKYVEKIPVAQA